MRRWRTAIGLAIAAVLWATAACGSSARIGDELVRECAAGVRFSCAALGLRHRYGDGVPLDLKKAYFYFERACRGGLLYACGYAGEMLIEGEGVAEDRQAGAVKLRDACAKGDAHSCTTMRRLGVEATRSGLALRE